jgi:hypothetical protein
MEAELTEVQMEAARRAAGSKAGDAVEETEAATAGVAEAEEERKETGRAEGITVEVALVAEKGAGMVVEVTKVEETVVETVEEMGVETAVEMVVERAAAKAAARAAAARAPG